MKTSDQKPENVVELFTDERRITNAMRFAHVRQYGDIMRSSTQKLTEHSRDWMAFDWTNEELGAL